MNYGSGWSLCTVSKARGDGFREKGGFFLPINWNIISAETRSKYIPVLQDQIYKSNVAFVLLDREDRIVLDGGVDVREPLLIAQEPNTWYTGFDPIDITPIDPGQQVILQWRFNAVGITIDGPAIIANGGEPRVLSLVETRIRNGELTIKDALGVGLFSSGTNAKMMDGLGISVNTGNTYGGINRATNAFWNAGAFYTTSAEPTFALIQQQLIGPCTQGNTKPNLAFTTQNIWNKLWAQALPQQRFDGGDEVTLGWDFIKIGSMRVYVDSHVPVSTFYVLNTEFLKIFVHEDYDFISTEWMPSLGQDAHTMRIHWAGNAILNNPRFAGVATALVET